MIVFSEFCVISIFPKFDFISAEPLISLPFVGSDEIDISSAKRKQLNTVMKNIKFNWKMNFVSNELLIKQFPNLLFLSL
jgi:hypothetical protein|tara:strand:+ start:3000 stop:3236 length:237 start_codon:yes stop_codon:yes gene_type:complete